jgi:hypothetical protein
MILRYSLKDGKVRREIIAQAHKRRLRGLPLPHDRHLSETILKAYYRLECEKGSKFRSGYSKDTIKRVHETALQRFDQTGVDR